MQLKEGNAKSPNIFSHLEFSFPKIIRKIKVYAGMDRDFARLCGDFEEIVETIKLLESTLEKTTPSILSQIAKYRQLKDELVIEIESFIQDEQKNI